MKALLISLVTYSFLNFAHGNKNIETSTETITKFARTLKKTGSNELSNINGTTSSETIEQGDLINSEDFVGTQALNSQTSLENPLITEMMLNDLEFPRPMAKAKRANNMNYYMQTSTQRVKYAGNTNNKRPNKKRYDILIAVRDKTYTCKYFSEKWFINKNSLKSSRCSKTNLKLVTKIETPTPTETTNIDEAVNKTYSCRWLSENPIVTKIMLKALGHPRPKCTNPKKQKKTVIAVVNNKIYTCKFSSERWSITKQSLNQRHCSKTTDFEVTSNKNVKPPPIDIEKIDNEVDRIFTCMSSSEETFITQLMLKVLGQSRPSCLEYDNASTISSTEFLNTTNFEDTTAITQQVSTTLDDQNRTNKTEDNEQPTTTSATSEGLLSSPLEPITEQVSTTLGVKQSTNTTQNKEQPTTVSAASQGQSSTPFEPITEQISTTLEDKQSTNTTQDNAQPTIASAASEGQSSTPLEPITEPISTTLDDKQSTNTTQDNEQPTTVSPTSEGLSSTPLEPITEQASTTLEDKQSTNTTQDNAQPTTGSAASEGQSSTPLEPITEPISTTLDDKKSTNTTQDNEQPTTVSPTSEGLSSTPLEPITEQASTTLEDKQSTNTTQDNAQPTTGSAASEGQSSTPLEPITEPISTTLDDKKSTNTTQDNEQPTTVSPTSEGLSSTPFEPITEQASTTLDDKQSTNATQDNAQPTTASAVSEGQSSTPLEPITEPISTTLDDKQSTNTTQDNEQSTTVSPTSERLSSTQLEPITEQASTTLDDKQSTNTTQDNAQPTTASAASEGQSSTPLEPITEPISTTLDDKQSTNTTQDNEQSTTVSPTSERLSSTQLEPITEQASTTLDDKQSTNTTQDNAQPTTASAVSEGKSSIPLEPITEQVSTTTETSTKPLNVIVVVENQTYICKFRSERWSISTKLLIEPNCTKTNDLEVICNNTKITPPIETEKLDDEVDRAHSCRSSSEDPFITKLMLKALGYQRPPCPDDNKDTTNVTSTVPPTESANTTIDQTTLENLETDLTGHTTVQSTVESVTPEKKSSTQLEPITVQSSTTLTIPTTALTDEPETRDTFSVELVKDLRNSTLVEQRNDTKIIILDPTENKNDSLRRSNKTSGKLVRSDLNITHILPPKEKKKPKKIGHFKLRVFKSFGKRDVSAVEKYNYLNELSEPEMHIEPKFEPVHGSEEFLVHQESQTTEGDLGSIVAPQIDVSDEERSFVVGGFTEVL